MKTILIPVDFSDISTSAVSYAVNYFGEEKVRYVLVNVYDEPTGASTGRLVDLDEIMLTDSQEQMAALTKEIEGYGLNLKLKAYILKGDIKTEIHDLADQLSADYIVVGTAGHQGVEDFIRGTVAYDIIREVKIPALVVPSNAKFDGINRVGFAADYQEIDSDVVFEPLVNLVQHTEATLDIVNIAGQSEQKIQESMVENRIKNLIDLEKVEFQWRYAADVMTGLEDYINEDSPSLIALVARPNGFFERLFLSSTVRQATLKLKIPFMVLRADID